MTTTATEHHTLTLGKIAQHPHNPRRDVGDVSDLAASIKSVGILQDLTVAPWPSDVDEKKPRAAEYVLIAGHRRLAAAKTAGLKQVPVKVIAAATLAEQLEAMIVENLQRSDLTPVEEAHAYQQLLDIKVPVKQIATVTGQTQTRVRDRLKLVRIPEAVQDLTHAGQITLNDALAFDEFKGDEEVLAKLTAAVGTDDWSMTLNRVRADKAAAAKFQDRVRTLEGKGVTFITQDELEALPYEAGAPGMLKRSYKGLDEYLPGVQYVYAWSSEADSQAEKHAACPGHRALADHTSRLVRYYCLTPTVHEVQAAATGDSVGDGDDNVAAIDEAAAQRQQEFAQRQAAQEKERLDLVAAHRTRVDHLAAVIKAGPSDELAGNCVRQALLEDSEDGWWGPRDTDVIKLVCEVLDLPGTVITLAYGEERDKALDVFWADALKDLSTAQVAVVLDIAMHAAHEIQLTNGSWDDGLGGQLWLDRLVDVYGYTLSTFDRDRLAATAGDDQDGADE